MEIAGVGNADIGSWRIEVINTDFTTNAAYAIDGGTRLGTASDDYGFYVLGDSNITSRDDLLSSPLPDNGGIQLVRGWNIVEDQVSYDTTFEAGGRSMSTNTKYKFVYAGVDQDSLFSGNPLSLVDDGGPGSNKTDFVWSETTGDFTTIGTTNIDQTLIPWPTNVPPVLDDYQGTATIGDVWRDGELVYFDVTTQATNLVHKVWSATNLLNIAWQEATDGFGWSRSNTTYQVWCDEVTAPAFYSITVTTAP